MSDTSVAFSIFGFDVYWYGLIIMCGVLVGIFISTKLIKRRGYTSEVIFDFLLLAIPLGIIGARLYYVAFSFEEFAGNLGAIFSLRMTGLAIYGAVIGGIVAALILCKWRKMSFWDITDAAVPALILAQAMGRWGNFFNQEVYGHLLTNVSGQITQHFALLPPAVLVGGEWHVALFFYESCWNLLSCLILVYFWKKWPEMRGGATWLYFALYSGARGILEGMRQTEYILKIGGIAVSQVLSIIICIISIGMVIYLFKRGGFQKKEVPEKYQITKKPEQGNEG